MCMSVPQIAVLVTLIRTSLGPTLGSGISSIQIPGSAFALTSAFMLRCSSGAMCASIGVFVCGASADDAQFPADVDEPTDGLLELLDSMPCAHLRADACLAHRHDRVGEPDHVHAALEQLLGKLRGQRRIPEHDWRDRVLARDDREAGR